MNLSRITHAAVLSFRHRFRVRVCVSAKSPKFTRCELNAFIVLYVENLRTALVLRRRKIAARNVSSISAFADMET